MAAGVRKHQKKLAQTVSDPSPSLLLVFFFCGICLHFLAKRRWHIYHLFLLTRDSLIYSKFKVLLRLNCMGTNFLQFVIFSGLCTQFTTRFTSSKIQGVKLACNWNKPKCAGWSCVFCAILSPKVITPCFNSIFLRSIHIFWSVQYAEWLDVVFGSIILQMRRSYI